jgi:hypothetical protein
MAERPRSPRQVVLTLLRAGAATGQLCYLNGPQTCIGNTVDAYASVPISQSPFSSLPALTGPKTNTAYSKWGDPVAPPFPLLFDIDGDGLDDLIIGECSMDASME